MGITIILEHSVLMKQALMLAERAKSCGEIPIGALIVYQNTIIAESYNQPIQQHDPTAHAEILAIRSAGKNLKNYRLSDCSLYVTLEPCMMCAAAIVHARIKTVIFGAYNDKAGAVMSAYEYFTIPTLNHHPDFKGGILEKACSQLLTRFFEEKRA